MGPAIFLAYRLDSTRLDSTLQGMKTHDVLDSNIAGHFFFSHAFFPRDKVSESCFTGQLPGIGTVFILASLQMCKVQRQSPLTNQREAAGVCWVWGELFIS